MFEHTFYKRKSDGEMFAVTECPINIVNGKVTWVLFVILSWNKKEYLEVRNDGRVGEDTITLEQFEKDFEKYDNKGEI